ncbi:MAG: YabP/YqfC family sporulation protein [Acutalibacter sp.]|jgi:sporulation protein YabP|nr:YabP/YqfC family sporulation protein [Acutalibacter sp.]
MAEQLDKFGKPERMGRPAKKHCLSLDNRERLTATGIQRVDFFSDELITAQTDLGQLNIKGEALHIESLNSDTGDMLVQGKVGAVSYTESVPALSFFGRLFK